MRRANCAASGLGDRPSVFCFGRTASVSPLSPPRSMPLAFAWRPTPPLRLDVCRVVSALCSSRFAPTIFGYKLLGISVGGTLQKPFCCCFYLHCCVCHIADAVTAPVQPLPTVGADWSILRNVLMCRCWLVEVNLRKVSLCWCWLAVPAQRFSVAVLIGRTYVTSPCGSADWWILHERLPATSRPPHKRQRHSLP